MDEMELARSLANRPGFMPDASDWNLARRLLTHLPDRVRIAESASEQAGSEVVRLDGLYRQARRDAEHFENVKIRYERILSVLFSRAGVQDAGTLEQRLIEYGEMADLARRLDLPGEGNPLTERFELYIARLILERDDAVSQLDKLVLSEVNP